MYLIERPALYFETLAQARTTLDPPQPLEGARNETSNDPRYRRMAAAGVGVVLACSFSVRARPGLPARLRPRPGVHDHGLPVLPVQCVRALQDDPRQAESAAGRPARHADVQ